MQVIDKAVTPDGIKIELRDLSGEHKLSGYNGLYIYFCTIAKNTSYPYAKKGEKFHSSIYAHGKYSSEMLKADYEELKNGTKTLSDLKAHFWNHTRDCFVLGL